MIYQLDTNFDQLILITKNQIMETQSKLCSNTELKPHKIRPKKYFTNFLLFYRKIFMEQTHEKKLNLRNTDFQLNQLKINENLLFALN